VNDIIRKINDLPDHFCVVLNCLKPAEYRITADDLIGTVCHRHTYRHFRDDDVIYDNKEE
jgi:hypothetical protein